MKALAPFYRLPDPRGARPGAAGTPAVEAAYWERAPGGSVRCLLCPKRCLVRPGAVGDCAVRGNEGGRLWALGYGRLAARAVEPVEKKPFFHYLPGSLTVSIGTFGCNMHCDYCQNWTISQRGPQGEAFTAPEEVVAWAVRARSADGRVASLCFTYTEPTVSFEYLRDVARLARREGFRVLLKTNGFLSPEPWEELLAFTDALNVDLKGEDDGYYARVLGGRLGPVRDAIRRAVAAGRHVEVTTLLVPGDFDDPEAVGRIAGWLASLSPDIALHLPRFYPDYLRGGPPADPERLSLAREAARRHLRYVYLTGSPRAGDTDTVCDGCGSRLVIRRGLEAELLGLDRETGACLACGRRHAFALAPSPGGGMLYFSRQAKTTVRVPPPGGE